MWSYLSKSKSFLKSIFHKRNTENDIEQGQGQGQILQPCPPTTSNYPKPHPPLFKDLVGFEAEIEQLADRILLPLKHREIYEKDPNLNLPVGVLFRGEIKHLKIIK